MPIRRGASVLVPRGRIALETGDPLTVLVPASRGGTRVPHGTQIRLLCDPDDYPTGNGPQGDAIRIYNMVRLVRSVD